ncbi:MAG: EAL domain-containing protein [Magnetospirillum sp.]|nr:EAL domain-containing protein [Magnetospirillum sp.]
MRLLPRSISGQMVLVISAVSAVVLGALVWGAMRHVENSQRQIAQSQMTLTRYIAEELDGKMDTALGTLGTLAATAPADVLAAPAAAAAWLDLHRDATTAFFDCGLFLLAADGRPLAVRTDAPTLAAAPEVRKWVTKTLWLEEPLVWPPFRGDDGHPHLMLAVPMPGNGAVLAGCIAPRRSSFFGGIERVTLGGSGYVFVTAWDGQLILHPDDSLLLRRDIAPLPPALLERASQGLRSAVETVDATGTPVLATFTKLQSTGWVLGANYPVSEAYASVLSFQRWAALALGIGILSAAVAARGMMLLFVAPIRHLARQIGDIEVSPNAELHPVSRGRGGHEIARVSAAFNRLIRRINADRERTMLASAVYENVREGILVTDADGHIVSVNRAFSDITGYTFGEVEGRNQRSLDPEFHDPDFFRDLWRTVDATGSWRGETWNRRKNGEVYPELCHIAAVRDGSGAISNYVTIFLDITDIKATQRKLETMATSDPLTGLPNRTLLADRLTQEIAQAHRRSMFLVVAFIDLDGFKAINDAEGHHVGDLLLIEAARRFQSHVREGDTVARLGGDEFVLLLCDVPDPAKALAVLQRILEATSAPYAIHGKLLTISASIGVTIYPADESDAETLMRHADQAMYQAKNQGRGRIHVFDAEQDRAVQTRYQEAERIRRALADGEMCLYYQPKVNLRDGRAFGLEALLRWNHPDRGLLTPPQFLSEFAADRITVEIGEWVIAATLRQIDAWWHAEGFRIPVSVNVSARHLAQAGFVEYLHRQFAEVPAIAPDNLEIEILESDALTDLAQVRRVIEECHQMGVTFAIDDFGTGYSSLAYLRNIPAEAVKIDRTFVRDMLTDPDDMAIVNGVIRLAGVFRCRAIAEGVETTQHASALLAIGCDLAQGFGIARPMPAEHLPPWLRRHGLKRLDAKVAEEG